MPELKKLEEQLGIIKKSDGGLDKVIEELKKITDESKLIEAKVTKDKLEGEEGE